MASTARFLWQRLEPTHGLIYFVPEADQHYTALGLDAGMMGYFASRSAAMGSVQAEVVVATFYNFEPGRVRSLVPQAWQRTTAAALWDARLAAVDAALTRIFGARLREPDIAEAAALLRNVTEACSPEGRPLFAGHLAQEWPAEPHLALWFAITLLREYRGDGHIAALTVEAVSGIEALVLHAATGSVPAAILQSTRGWDDASWATAVEGLVRRGWLDDEGALTASGRQHRNRVEQYTDELAAAPWRRLPATGVDRLGDLGKELTGGIVSAGTFPGR
ncbi:MAG: hypothetical protein WCC60_17645 [Ilumatobacteraceae bacterium]